MDRDGDEEEEEEDKRVEEEESDSGEEIGHRKRKRSQYLLVQPCVAFLSGAYSVATDC